MKRQYVVPEYIVVRNIDMAIVASLPELKPQHLPDYKSITKRDLAKQYKLFSYDVALPADWVKDFEKVTGINPVPIFVWDYTHRHGRPFPLTTVAETALEIYYHIKEA